MESEDDIPITPAKKSYQWREINPDLPFLLSDCYECIESPVTSWLRRLLEIHTPTAPSATQLK